MPVKASRRLCPFAAANLASARFAARSHQGTGCERELAWTTEQLEGLGLRVHPSQTNFVLARFPNSEVKTASAANDFLLSRGIIPRRINGPDYAGCLRLSIGEADEMETLVDTLREFLEA